MAVNGQHCTLIRQAQISVSSISRYYRYHQYGHEYTYNRTRDLGSTSQIKDKDAQCILRYFTINQNV